MRQLGGFLGCWEYMAHIEGEVLLSEGAFFPPRIHSKFKDLEKWKQGTCNQVEKFKYFSLQKN